MKTLIRVSIFLILSFAAFEANAFCVFSVGDGHLICTTCSCAELAAAGVSMTGCVDVLAMASSPGGGMPVVKIVRYSDTKVVLVTKDGKEYPLASDESQKQFENLMKRDGWQKLMSSFQSHTGEISNGSIEKLANQLGLKKTKDKDEWTKRK